MWALDGGKKGSQVHVCPAKTHALAWLDELVATDGTKGSTHLAMAGDPCCCWASWGGGVGTAKQSLYKHFIQSQLKTFVPSLSDTQILESLHMLRGPC